MSEAKKPMWRRIADFPLVAMVLAVGLMIGTSSLFLLLKKLVPALDTPETMPLRAVLLILALLVVYKLVIAKLGSQPRDDLPWKGSGSGLLLGLVFGLLLFSAIVGVAALLHVYRIVGDGGTQELVSALVSIAIVPAFTEELLFRGILFRWLEEFVGSWAALALTSALFGAAHIMNPNATLLSSLAIAIEAGVLLGAVYMLTRNLWMAMGLHAAWNFTQGEIFDVPVSGIDSHGLVEAQLSGPPLLSGGAFGLEASVIAMVMATAAGAWLVMLAVRRGQLVAPMWVRRRLAVTEASA